MADDTLREFLWSRFERTITSATLQAKLLGDAIEAMARSVASHVADVANSFEQLYWQSQRLRRGVDSRIRLCDQPDGRHGRPTDGPNARER